MCNDSASFHQGFIYGKVRGFYVYQGTLQLSRKRTAASIFFRVTKKKTRALEVAKYFFVTEVVTILKAELGAMHYGKRLYEIDA